jgi:hypothetical protein
MTTQIDYPECAINIKSGTDINTLSSSSIILTNTSTNTLELSPASLNIVNIPNNNHLEISDDTISHYRTGSLNTFFINQDGFVATDASGNSNGVYLGTLTTSNANGTYLNINYSQGININGNAGSEGQALKKDASNNMIWATGIADWVGTATTDLNMASYSINNVSSINAISATDLPINGQVVFNAPPHCDTNPVLGNDLTNKGYVDSLVGQYGGSLNLFFNYSDSASSPPAGYKQLSPTITTALTTAVNTTTNGTTEVEVESFITTQLNIDSLPAGVWSGNFNGRSEDKNATISYVMRVYKYTIDNVETEIGTGATSTYINTEVTADYYAYLVVPTTPLALTDRLVVKLFVVKTGSGANKTITTNFEGEFYSYVSSSLNAGTTLLSSNNVWTGTNNFEAFGIKSTSIDSATTLNLGTGTATTSTLGKSTGITNINGNTIPISGTTSTTITAPTINLVGNVKSTNIDSATTLTIGNGTTTTTTLGRSAGITAVNGNTIPITGTTSITVTAPTINLVGNVKSTNIDSATTLTIGNGTATTSTLGRTSNTATNINGGSIGISGNTTITGTASVSSTFINNTIQTSLSSSNASLWNNNITGTLDIINGAGRTGIVNMLKSTEDNYLNIGGKTGTTKGLRYVIDGYDLYFITLTNTFQNGITCPSLNSNDPLTIGTSLTSQGVTIGYSPYNTIINGLSTIIEGQLTNNNIVGIDTSTAITAWNNVTTGNADILIGNLTGSVNILTGATRSATTLMLTGTTANTFRIGSGSSGLTFIVRGLETTLTSATTTISSATTTISSATTTISSATTNFTGTTNSFTNAIKGSGSNNLLVSAPIQPSSLTYSATGTTANAIGQIISNGLTPAQDITGTAVTALNNLTFQITAGVWLITASISCVNQNGSNQTYSRIITNIGSGLTGNTNSNIVINTDTNVLLSTVTAGSQKIGNVSAVFSTNATTFISVSVQVSTPTALLPLRFQTASTLTATRIA